MKRVKTKAEIRGELEREVECFLSKGGSIKDIKQGASGKELGASINRAFPLNPEPHEHTLLTKEMRALDARKQQRKHPPKKNKKPKKRIIYDDFGEPVREVWDG